MQIFADKMAAQTGSVQTTNVARSVDGHVVTDSQVQAVMGALEGMAHKWRATPRPDPSNPQVTDHWALIAVANGSTQYGGMIVNAGSSLNPKKGDPNVDVKKGPLGEISQDELASLYDYLSGRLTGTYSSP